MTRKQYFLSGLKDGMPICFGYFAVSFAFGIQAAGIGLSVLEASVLSALNVTSAGQFAALAKPAPWAPPRHRLRHDG